MANLSLSQVILEKDKTYTPQELAGALAPLCDADYNGENGEEYFDEEENKSHLQVAVEKCLLEKKSLQETVTYVMSSNYKNDPYYEDYSVKCTEMGNVLVVAVASMG